MKKESYARYNERYPWSYDGIKDERTFAFYGGMVDVYQALEKEYNDLISQSEKFID